MQKCNVYIFFIFNILFFSFQTTLQNYKKIVVNKEGKGESEKRQFDKLTKRKAKERQEN